MKLKEYFYMLGFKPKTKEYGFKLKHFNLPEFGDVKYAQWLHPSETQKEIKYDVIEELRSYLNEGDFCIDIGAHTGDTALPFALAVGKNGAVLALEPNKYVFKILEENVRLNTDKSTIIPLMAAATDHDGEFEFEYSDAGFCNGGLHEGISKWKHGHAFKMKIQGINLAQLLRDKYSDKLPKLNFIKIDTEGYDLSVLKSIIELVKKYRPHLHIEIFKNTSLAYREEMHNLLSSLNYSIYRVNSDIDLQGDELSKADLMTWVGYDIFCIPT